MSDEAKRGQVTSDLGGSISGPGTDLGSQLEAVACQQPGHVDLRDARWPNDVLHVPADVFALFAEQIRGGVYDHLLGS
ncbi:MAG: hypothetical protein ACRDNZ_00720 [Streptosporangiaceae bacterium]